MYAVVEVCLINYEGMESAEHLCYYMEAGHYHYWFLTNMSPPPEKVKSNIAAALLKRYDGRLDLLWLSRVTIQK